MTVTDVYNETSLTMTPKFPLGVPQQDQNRLIYPIKGRPARKVYTFRGASIKEDIILDEKRADEMHFSYDVTLPPGTEMRLEADGSIGVYGVSSVLLGNVTTGTEADAALLEKARNNGAKNNLIFTIPKPVVFELDRKVAQSVTSYFEIKDSTVTLVAKGLRSASYPLSIDPTIYIETAEKLMRGNNETNTDFDVSNGLIQKSQTTGARIDAWEENQDINAGLWDNSSAAAGGYIYSAGGRTSTTKPYIVGSQGSVQASNSGTFTMNMPSVRPAGDLYVALMCRDGAGGTVNGPSGWTSLSATDMDEFGGGWYKIGTDQGGGNEAASYDWTLSTGTEEWAGVIIRIKGFNSTTPITGTPGTTNTTGTPTFPATTPGAASSLVVRAIGINDDDPSTRTWVPTGHTKIYSGSSSTGTGSCGFAAASLNVPPAAAASTGTAALTQSSLSDSYGGMSFAINPATVTASNQTSVYWAKFNTTSQAIESPNPGAGTCSAWCTSSSYDLPEARRGFSLVAYNGYLYAIGGSDGTNLESTVFIAKIGANGEPQLWHPTDSNKNNWVYWYTDTGLSSARAYHSAFAYNNRMYVMGGDSNTTANSGSMTTVEIADILPNGRLGTWASGSALPTARYSHSTVVYNDVVYLVGGNNNGTMLGTVHYNKLNSDGTMNTWTSTNAYTGSARSNMGGQYATIWGAYVYLAGGCTAVNASGYCTTYATDTQIASINADGTISPWGGISSLENQRIGYNLIGWQNALYRVSGCVQQNTSTGECTTTLADVDYGVINPAGEVSTVNISSAANTGVCSGASPQNCDLPAVGDDANEIGHMLNMSAILNGYLYVIGGCAEYNCNDAGNSPTNDNISSNTAYVAIDSNGALVRAPSCAAGFVTNSAWCVDATNTINGADGVAAAGITIFNNRIYVLGGLDSTGVVTGELYYNTVNPLTGALTGAWTAQTLSSVGITEDIFYTYIYARANPSQAGTYDGNLFVFGGCGTGGSGAGCNSNDYETEVYKCWIEDTGEIEDTAGSATYDCTTSGQLQIDSTPPASYSGDVDLDGLGIHSGTVYANYIYLIGGISQNETDKDDVIYAEFDDNNNVVAVDGGSNWIESTSKLSVGRRRGWAFGYNGHIYAVGGYDDTVGTALPFIEWAKINVSDGSLSAFVTSSVQINQRWGLNVAVSNSYAYVIGGCDVGTSPTGCSSFEEKLQTFQLYNNDSGSINDFTAQSDDTFNTVATEDRWGASAAVLNGYLYVAGGCISATDCTDATNNTQYASLNASDGTVNTWADGGNLPADRAWGWLEAISSTLYYFGGQNDGGTAQTSVYYTSSISSGNPTWASVNVAGVLPEARTKFGGAVWGNRLYVIGGLNASSTLTNTVLVSPQLTNGGNITSAWSTSTTSFDIARRGHAATAYGNNLYVFGGFDGTNYLSDVQFASLGYKTGTISQSGTTVTGSGTTFTSAMVGQTLQYPDGSTATITAYSSATSITVSADKTVAGGTLFTVLDGSVGSWTFTTSMPDAISDARAISANGYFYLVGGRIAATTCNPKTLITPISANTTNATGNNPTGVGEWYETNVRYTSDRYGAAVAYDKGKIYTMGGGCTAPIDCSTASVCNYYSTVKSQPQTAVYSRLIDTDSNVFPNSWLVNGLDNSVGARWQADYRSAIDASNVTMQSSFDGSASSNGATISSSDVDLSACSSAGGGARQYSNTRNVTPNFSANFFTTSSGSASCNKTFTDVQIRYDRFYFYYADNPAANTLIYTLDDATTGSNRVVGLELAQTTDTLRILDNGTFDASVNVVEDAWNRVEIGYVGTSNQVIIRVYSGSNLHTTTVSSTATVTLDAASRDTQADIMTVGVIPTSATWTGIWVDEIQSSASNWVGTIFPDWGQKTSSGDVIMGDVRTFTPLDSSGSNTQFARWYYFKLSIDASKTFGYPEDVSRGPTVSDLSLFFTSDPNKRLRHGKTFTGGEMQPLDTPCRQTVDGQCPLP